MTVVGTALCLGSAVYMAAAYYGKRPLASFRSWGYGGLALIAAAAVFAVWRVPLGATYLTPIFWTGYILVIDAAVFSLRGRSMIGTERPAFFWMAVLSIPLWLIFEAYNLRLQNWIYVGLPGSLFLRPVGYLWSFATIWPGIFVTADFLQAARFPDSVASQPAAPKRPGRLPWLGLLCLAVPVLVPPARAVYLFGLVWLGFIFLWDPLNEAAGRPSILADLRQGRHGRLSALLLAGLFCGFFWEFWNYWATARWLYIFPILQRFKMFEMPVLGYLGFPPFAVEVYVMYVYAAGRFRLPFYAIGSHAAAWHNKG